MNATNILQRAVQYDADGRHLEAFTLYEDGIRALLDICKSESDPAKKLHYQSKIKEYIERAEQIKKLIQKHTIKSEVITRIPIMEGSTGHSYKSLFGKYLTEDVHEVQLEEPYIREHYQFVNLIIFLELLIKKCRKLKIVEIKTTIDPKSSFEQQKHFDGIKLDLERKGITITFEICDNLHDRQIILSSGYIIKIGRGLHFYKGPTPKYSLGLVDFDFRQCMETNLDIFKSH